MKVILKEAQEIPPFYGIAYYDFEKGHSVCYPIFVNLIVLLFRDFKRWLRNPKGKY